MTTSHKLGFSGALGLLLTLGLILATVSPASAYPRPGVTERVSVASDGTQGWDDKPHQAGTRARSITMSSDGRYVAFTSYFSNLVEGDNNLVSDVFVHDRRGGSTELVSVTAFGDVAVCLPLCPDHGATASYHATISANGRYVAFASSAMNLVPGDTNLSSDVFVHDRATGSTERASVDSRGSEGNADSPPVPDGGITYENNLTDISISGSGRRVAFMSEASNLAPHDTNSQSDYFVHDRNKDTTAFAVVTSGGAPGGPCGAVLSANGRYVLFADHVLPGSTDDYPDAVGHVQPQYFRRDLASGRIVAVPRAGGSCYNFSVSGDGKRVAYELNDGGLVTHIPADDNGAFDTFVYDFESQRFRRVSVTSAGEQTEAPPGSDPLFGPTLHASSVTPILSLDGKVVTFASYFRFFDERAGDGDGNGSSEGEQSDMDQFVHVLATGATEWISVDPKYHEVDCGTTSQNPIVANAFPAIDRSGRSISFVSCAQSLVTDRAENINPAVGYRYDVFVRDRGLDLGADGFGGSQGRDGDPADDRICINPELCIPPGQATSAKDNRADVSEILTKQGANLYGASLAYRPQSEDLFARIELEDMPPVIGPVPLDRGLLYGMTFSINDNRYEVRAQRIMSPDFNAAGGASFGLFHCNKDTPLCTKVGVLRGGYGTTGKEVVVSLPLDKLGLEDGGELRDVQAFTTIGSYLTGPTKILDRVTLN